MHTEKQVARPKPKIRIIDVISVVLFTAVIGMIVMVT